MLYFISQHDIVSSYVHLRSLQLTSRTEVLATARPRTSTSQKPANNFLSNTGSDFPYIFRTPSLVSSPPVALGLVDGVALQLAVEDLLERTRDAPDVLY